MEAPGSGPVHPGQRPSHYPGCPATGPAPPRCCSPHSGRAQVPPATATRKVSARAMAQITRQPVPEYKYTVGG